MRTLTVLLSMALSLTAYANENEQEVQANHYNAVAGSLFEQIKGTLETTLPIASFTETAEYQDFGPRDAHNRGVYVRVSWNPVFYDPKPVLDVVVANVEGADVPFNHKLFQSGELAMGRKTEEGRFRYEAIYKWQRGHFGEPTGIPADVVVSGLAGASLDLHGFGGGVYLDHNLSQNRSNENVRWDELVYVGTSVFVVTDGGFNDVTHAVQAELGVMGTLTDNDQLDRWVGMDTYGCHPTW